MHTLFKFYSLAGKKLSWRSNIVPGITVLQCRVDFQISHCFGSPKHCLGSHNITPKISQPDIEVLQSYRGFQQYRLQCRLITSLTPPKPHCFGSQSCCLIPDATFEEVIVLSRTIFRFSDIKIGDRLTISFLKCTFYKTLDIIPVQQAKTDVVRHYLETFIYFQGKPNNT